MKIKSFLQSINFGISALNIKVSGSSQSTLPGAQFSFLGISFGWNKPGFMRYLLYVSVDPIGWKSQLLFRVFAKNYAKKYEGIVERINYPHGRPQRTKGLKAKEAKKEFVAADGSKVSLEPLGPKPVKN